MERILFDTNIIIYLLNGDPGLVSFFEKWNGGKIMISMVSWIETLAGSYKHNKKIHEIEKELENFEVVFLYTRIARLAAQMLEIQHQQNNGKIRFRDTVIAATALSENIPLLTNNPNDFQRFKGLKIITPK